MTYLHPCLKAYRPPLANIACEAHIANPQKWIYIAEKDGFAVFTDGFELLKMMPPPSAANDISPLTLRNDVASIGRNDAMFASHMPQHTSLPQAASLAKLTSFARKGKHH